MSSQKIVIRALVDEFPLVAHRFDPPVGVALHAAVVISCATGVRANFYKDFSIWLTNQGIGVITYDYRYTGSSWPKHLQHLVGRNATPESWAKARRAVPEELGILSHWAKRDAAAVVLHASATWPDVPLTSLGHSMGGQLAPLFVEVLPRVTRILNVCGGNMCVSWHPNREALVARFRKHLAPLLERDRIFYGSKLGLGEDLPYSPGVEWLRCFTHPQCAQRTAPEEKATRALNKPYLFIGFDDDLSCTKEQLNHHMPQFSHSDGLKSSLWITPSVNTPAWPACGHAESFAKSAIPSSYLSSTDGNKPLTREETIWPVYRDWILHGRIEHPERIGEYRVWKPEDEFDPLDRVDKVFHIVDLGDSVPVKGKGVISFDYGARL